MDRSKRSGVIFCGLAISLAAWAATSRAGSDAAGGGASLSLDELQNIRLSASSFFEVSRESAPGTTYVVDQEKLASAPNRTLAETLEMAVPGVHVAKHLWTGSIIGVRGITIDNNAKTLVMLDGFNLNMRTHFGTHGLLSLPLLGDVERLEVSTGPGSLVHGSGAINGHVNLIPRDGAAHGGLEATAELGPLDGYGSVQIGYGLTYGKTNNLYLYGGFAAAGGLQPRGDLSWSCTGPGEPMDRGCPYTWIQARDMGPSYKGSLNWNHGSLNVVALFVRALQSTEGNALYNWYFYEDPQWMSTIAGLRPQYTLSFSDSEDLILSVTLLLQDYGMIPRHPRRPGMGTMMVDWNFPPRVGRESSSSARVLLRTLRLPGSSLAVGVEVGYRRFDRAKQYFGGAGQRLGFEDANFQWLELAGFAEDTFTWKNLSLTGGLRFEYFKNPRRFQLGPYREADTMEMVMQPSPVSLTDHRALVGRLGAALALPREVTVRASYQRGFRNPDASYYTHWAARDAINKGMNLDGLPPLDNETMDSFELDFSQTVSPVLVGYVNSYYNRYQKLLAWIDPLKTFFNDPNDVRSIGAELGAELAVSGHRASAAYGYSQPLGYSAGTYSPLARTSAGRTSWTAYSPHQVKVSLAQSLLADRLQLTLAGAFYSKVDDPEWAAGQRHRLLVNASVRYAFTPQIQASLVLQNLTGNDVPAPRLDNRLTQVGNLGIEQRLVYLSLGLRLR
jgi:outer membrane receptor protein involved in Fe transport